MDQDYHLVLTATEPKIMGALEALNQQFGRDTLHLAASGLQPWGMRSNHRTPCYTTRREDLPRATAK